MEKKIVILNGQKVNYDHLIDYHVLSKNVVVYEDTKEELLEHIGDAEIIVTKELSLPGFIIEQVPSTLKLIVEAGTGYNNIDIQKAKEKGITVCNVPAYSSQRVAQTALMMMLNLSSWMQLQIRMLERKDYRNFTQHLLVPHSELNNKVLGIVGAGHIGQELMKAALALGMDILVYQRHSIQESEHVHQVSLEQLLKESDYISLHCPLTTATKHMINKETLSLMKPTAFLINTSRGALINEEDLITALKNHQIAGAGLDVQEQEPPVEDNPLYQLDNVILTPHMGWKGKETRERLLNIVKENIEAYLKGKPQNVVN